MNISLENWLRNKLQENEETQDYAVATDTVRCWIDEYRQLSQPAVISCSCDNGIIVCPGCNGEESQLGICAGCKGSGIRTCGKCGGKNKI